MAIVLSCSAQKAKAKIEKSILDYIGILGYAQSALQIVEIGKTQKNKTYSIISINRSFVDKVKASFAFSKIQCIGVSGSVLGVRRFL